ncbi:MFS transporter [Bythopirellula polymerisocia]|uniref:MFS transporter n=1 Tax=Bythopirellula polymerisocia TaxID=2528003 RepID=UPI0018D34C16|nr:MFS transporter [Bythopirellula polymerisocia]
MILTFLLSVLLYVDRICISAAKNEISADLHLDDRQMGWAMSLFALGYALFQTPGGRLADVFGARKALSLIVLAWSAFTGLTGLVKGYLSLLVVRFLFGASEAGAFPSIARATYGWTPMGERGLVQGVVFSGSRIGGAASLALLPILIDSLGWRGAFLLLTGVGVVWAIVWFWWFRDDPRDHQGISSEELDYVLANRQQKTCGEKTSAESKSLRLKTILSSRNVQLLAFQYFCSNFTFFFCLTWLFPHLQKTYQLSGVEAGFYAAAPLVAGACGNWTSGFWVDRLYRRGLWRWSRRIPAGLGFVLGATGLLGHLASSDPIAAISWFCLAVFGADMTLSPSWSTCIDIAKSNAGTVSGLMNMAGNIGSFVTALAFPYLAAWVGSNGPFFLIAALLNASGAAAWLLIDPQRELAKV